MTPATVMSEELRVRLRARYGVPVRAYHSFAHAAHVATLSAELGGRRACLLAAWFHDAVYEPGRSDNEERSALLLEQWLAADPDVDEAARLVRVTASHDPDRTDRQAAILCDADLAVLGSTPADYAVYRSAVRREYAHVDDPGWRSGRAAVLQGLLDRPRIYRTDRGLERWEQAARHNITAEIAGLDS